MVAIVSGNSLGLNLTSKGVLGDAGVAGDPTTGRAAEQVYVDAATGNLVLQQFQDELVGTGPDVAAVLTYNSQGLHNDDNGDNFSLGGIAAQLVLSGTVNQSGSSVTVTTFDGAQQVYAWDGARYASTAGGGAYDTITYAAGKYTCVDGSSQQVEVYDGSSGHLLSRADDQGNKITFAYTGTLLTSVTNSDTIGGVAHSETVFYDYTGNLLQGIRKQTDVVDASGNFTGTSTQTLVTYTYDASNRLTNVIVDLSPADGSIADGKVYKTTFTYADASNRIYTMKQSDGTSLTFLYDASSRVQTITDALGNATNFSYDTAGRKTSVSVSVLTTASGQPATVTQTTVYGYDASGQLTSVTAPAPAAGVAGPVTSYAYDANGNVTTITDGANRVTRMTYDANGNLASTFDPDGDQTLYTYDAGNRLLTQTRSTLVVPAMTTGVGVAVSGGTVSKTGTSGAWDAATQSAISFAGGAAVNFTVAQTNAALMVGLTADPGLNNGFDKIDWAISCTASGRLEARQNGVAIDLNATYVAGDSLGVRYDGGTVNYLKNGQVLLSVAATLDDPLFVATTFADANGRIDNLRLGAVSSDDAARVSLQGVPLLATVGGMTVAGDIATKTGTTTGWDSSVRSPVGLLGGAAASFTATSTSKSVMVGLDSETADTASYASLDFAAYLRNDGILLAYKDGAKVTTIGASGVIGSFKAGDRISVVYDGAYTVNWLQNGAVVGTLTLTAMLAQPLHLDSSFLDAGGSVTGLRFGGFDAQDPIRQKLAPVMANSSGVSIGGGTLTKTGGVNGTWDASARSALSLSGGAQVAFTVATAGKDLSLGLNGDPASSPLYTSLDYAFVLTSTNQLQAWSSGVKVADIGTYATGDRLVLRSDGVNVTWTVNGLVRSTIAVVGSGAQPLYVDTSFSSSGASIADLIFDSGTPVAQASPLPVVRISTSTNISIPVAGTLKKTGGTNGVWDAAARSANAIVGGAAVAFTASVLGTYQIGLSAAPDAGDGRDTIDYGVYVTSAGTIAACKGNTQLQALGSYAVGDRLGVTCDGERVYWLKNGKVLFSTAVTITAPLYVDSSFFGLNAKVTNLCFGSSDMADPFASGDAPALQPSAGVTVQGGDVIKTGGVDGAWDATAQSVYGHVGGATVSFTAETPYDGVVVGLNTSPAAAVLFGLYLSYDGSLSASENGTLVALNQTYVAGDRFSISFDGRQAVYVKNGQVLRTVAATAAQALFVHLSLRNLGAKVSDLAFTGAASTDQTTRNVYSDDGKGRLRYTISAAGRVTEYGYSSVGVLTSTNEYVQASYSMVGLASSVVPSEADLNAWRGMQDLSLTQRTDIRRDWRQQVSSTVAYSAANADGTGASVGYAITNYVYDPAGRLLQKAEGAAITTYVYDGLGRISLVSDPLGRKTATQYDDANSTITITASNTVDATTRVATEIFDKAGRLVSVSNSGTGLAQATTSYDYDAAGRLLRTTDPTGVQTWSLYYNDGRKVADVDGEGVFTQYDYDASNLLTREIVRGSKLSAATLAKFVDANGKPRNPALADLGITYSPATDRATWNVYDAAGRLRQSIDAVGAVTQVDYDGAGRVLATTAFAQRIDPSTLAALTAPSLRLVAASSADRVARKYYDADGRLVGQLDADRYLSAYQYDGKGRVTVTTRYATQVPGTGFVDTLDEATPAPSIDDQRSVTLYDLMGRVSGQIDAEGILTESTYDTRGNLLASTRYATAVGTAVDPDATVDAVRPTTSIEDRSTSWLYDNADRATQSTNYEGVQSSYTYANNSDDVIANDQAQTQPDERVTEQHVDALGRVTATLSGVGHDQIATLGVNTAWANYGTKIAYDLAGRRISATDALGNQARYFYDQDNRLRYTVDATGAVQEVQYDSFGQVKATLRYGAKVSLAAIGAGGLVTTGLATAMAASTMQASGVATTTAYLLNGLAASVTDAMGYRTANTAYDAFGDVTTRTASIAGGATRTDLYTYDHRGNVLTSQLDNGGLAIAESSQYDAFGRQVQHVDARQQVTTTAYDRLGNVIQRTDPLNPASAWTYDAFGQVLSYSNAGADPTNYVYSRAGRSVTATPPGLAATTAVHSHFGQAQTVTDANGVTTISSYDDDGHLTQTKVGSTVTFTAQYDAAGNRVTSQDGNGVVNGAWTYYTYDADNRLEYVVDPTGGVTHSEYDALGRTARVTRYAAKIQTMPTNGVAIKSAQVVVSLTAGVDQITARRYDGDDRVTWEVDGLGAATNYAYGDRGTAAQRTRYFNTVDLTQWNVLTGDPTPTASGANDRTERWTYDALDRMTLAVDANGSATAYTYDASGHVTQARQYASAVPSGGAFLITSAGGNAQAVLALPSFVNDTVTATVRFKAAPGQSGQLYLGNGSTSISSGWVAGTNGWATLSVQLAVGSSPTSLSVYLYAQNAGTVTYDDLRVSSTNLGSVVDTSFDNFTTGTTGGQWTGVAAASQTYVSLASAGTDAQLQAFVASIADPVRDRVTRSSYDADGRLAVRVDATGAATQYSYDADGNLAQVRRAATLATAAALGAATTDALLQSLVSALLGDNDLVSANVYDGNDRLHLQVNAAGAVTAYAYDANGNATQVTQYATPIVGGGLMSAAALTEAVAALPANALNRVTVNEYDTFNRLTWTADPLRRVTQRVYDADGNVTSVTRWATPLTSAGVMPHQVSTTAGGLTSRFAYDGAGRELYRSDARGVVTGTTYDGAGNAVTRTQYATLMPNVQPNAVTAGPLDRTQRMRYDADGRLRYQADPLLFVTGHVYDAFGDETMATRYFTPLASGQTDPSLVTLNSSNDLVLRQYYNADGRLYLSDDGLRTRYAYDAFGELAYTVSADGAIAKNEYDADGRVLRTTRYATALMPAPLAALSTLTQPGQVALLVTASPGKDGLALNQYDTFGRMRYSMDGTGAISEWRYDAAGNVTDRLAYAKLPIPAWTGAGAPQGLVASATDRDVHMSYDAFGDVLAQADNTGAVVASTYDGAGQRTDRLSYANTIAPSSWTSGAQPSSLQADPTRDIHERFEYDAYGQLRYQADGTGAITALQYDESGNLIAKIARATPATAGATLASVAGLLADRTNRFAYDHFNARTGELSADNSLTGTLYDFDGRVVSRTQYATPAASIPGSLSDPASTDVATTVANLDRTTTLAYDSFGRLRYQTNPRGYVAMTTYDTHDRVQSQVQFRDRQTVPVSPTAALLTIHAYDEQTQFGYDGVGRVNQRTDAENGVQQYGYDGLGNKTSFINEKSLVWTYAYDADGRLLSETTPQVNVTTVANLLATPTIENVVTSMTYDGVGNLLTRTEASTSANPRTTTYDYDADGRQTKVTSQAFRAYTQTLASLGADTLVGSAARVESLAATSVTSITFYDAFGNAVANVGTTVVNSSGSITPVSYKTYDRANRLSYEIDAKGYVTGYARDVFGEALTLTRYSTATALAQAVPTSAADAPTSATVAAAVAASSTTNRQLTYTYDAMGRVTQTTGMGGYFYDAASDYQANTVENGAAPITTMGYDAFGQLVLERQWNSQNTYAATYRYFDAAGQQIDTVDARGFLTHNEFDAFGNTTKTTEYANAKTDSWGLGGMGATPTTSSSDRVATFTFDQLNRKLTERHTLNFQNATDIANRTVAISGTGTLTTYVYDALGNVIHTANEAGDTYMEYDSLGRLRALISPGRAQALSASKLAPLTEFWYDALGQRTVQIDHANGATAVVEFIGVWQDGTTKAGYSNAASTSDDRVTYTAYDRAGHVTEVDAPMASSANSAYRTYNSYDVAGRLAKTWHTVSGKTAYQAFEYDALGQAVKTYAPISGSGAQSAVDTDYTYNGFGEVTAKGVQGTNYESFDYDNNGNLWRSKTGDGATRVFLYDVMGRQTATVLSNGLTSTDHNLTSFASSAWASAYAAILGGGPSYRQTDTVYDKLGNVVTTIGPERANSIGGFSIVNLNVDLFAEWENPVLTAHASWGDLSALGSGDVSFTYGGVAGIPASGSALVSSGTNSTSWLGIRSSQDTSADLAITVRKKDVNGDWRDIARYSKGNARLPFAEIAAPTGATNVQMTYSGPSSGTASVFNMGNVWMADLSALTAGTYSFTTTYTYPDGSTSASVGSFVIDGATHANAAGSSYVLPTTVQTFDRWGNVLSRSDPRSANWLTKFTYNANNQLIKQVQGVNAADQSQWGGYNNARAVVTAAPTTQIYYDAQGNQSALTDANGNTTFQRYDAAGHVIETDQAWGTANSVRQTTSYDLFGRKVSSISGRGFDASGNLLSSASDFTTTDTYVGNLVTETRGTTSGGNVAVWSTSGSGSSLSAANASRINLAQASTYDEDGNLLTSTDATGAKTTYTYDLAGHQLSVTTPAVDSVTTTSSKDYDVFGHLKSSTNAKGDQETWTYDYFGKRTMAHKDLAGNTYTYAYDNAGDLTSQVNSAGQAQSFSYDAAGQLLHTSQLVSAGTTPVYKTTDYSYDRGGERLRETTTQAGVIYQDNHLAYDVLGHLVDSADESVHVSFGYDAVGNRIHTSTHVIVDGQHAPTTNRADTFDTDDWNTFDALGRQAQTMTNHLDATTSIVSTDTHTLTYDANSNRISDTHLGNSVVANVSNGIITGYSLGASNVSVKDNYEYDADDRLLDTYRVGGTYDPRQVFDMRGYDAAGRTVIQGPNAALPASYATALNTGITDSSLQSGMQTLISSFDARGQLRASRVQDASGTTKSTTDLSDVGSGTGQTQGYDLAGNLVGNKLTTYGSGNYSLVTQTAYDKGLDGYRQSAQTATKTGTGAGTDTTAMGYDLDGQLASFVDTNQTSFSRNYVNDTNGQVLATLIAQGRQLELSELVINGQVIGQYGTGIDAVQPQQPDSTANYTERANFGFGFRQISQTYPAATVGSYTVQLGDTLQSIADQAYGDSSQWWRIAQANGIASDASLQVGQTVSIPAAATGGTHNSASTFQPYDPSKILGDMGARFAMPTPFQERCATMSVVIGVVVAAVVGYFAGPLAGAAAGDAARQYSSAAFNDQLDYTDLFEGGGIKGSIRNLKFVNEYGLVNVVDPTGGWAAGAWGLNHVPQPAGFTREQKYNYKSTALAVAAAYVGSEAGAFVGDLGNPVVNAMATAAVANVATQGVGIAIGEQKAFSWKSLAAATAQAGVERGLGTVLAEDGPSAAAADSSGFDYQKLTTGFVTNFSGGLTLAVVKGGSFSVARVAANAFGSELASSITEISNSAPQPESGTFGNAIGSSLAIAGTSDSPNLAQQSFRESEISGENWNSRVAQALALAGPGQSEAELDPTFSVSAPRFATAQGLNAMPASWTAGGTEVATSPTGRAEDLDTSRRNSALDGQFPSGVPLPDGGTALGYEDKNGPYFRVYHDGIYEPFIPSGGLSDTPVVSVGFMGPPAPMAGTGDPATGMPLPGEPISESTVLRSITDQVTTSLEHNTAWNQLHDSHASGQWLQPVNVAAEQATARARAQSETLGKVLDSQREMALGGLATTAAYLTTGNAEYAARVADTRGPFDALFAPRGPGGARTYASKNRRIGNVEGAGSTFKPYSGDPTAPDFVGPLPNTRTRFVNGVVVVDQRTGQVYTGTVDLQPTLDRIKNGNPNPHRNDGSVFQNRPPVGGNGQPLLPAQSPGYYTEYVVPTPGVNGPGPQRIVVGGNGEMYYTPDHYGTFVPIKH